MARSASYCHRASHLGASREHHSQAERQVDPAWAGRLVDATPHGHWETTTMIGALGADGSTALKEITPQDAHGWFESCGYRYGKT